MKKLLIGLVLAAAAAELPAAEWQNDAGVIRTWNAGRFLPPESRRGQAGFEDVVVLENTDLADVEVVSSVANANGWTSADIHIEWFRETLFPYCVTKTSATEVNMLMMNCATWPTAYNAGSTAEIRLYLYQKGDDVCASVAAARYVMYYDFCGIDIFNDPFVAANYQVNPQSIAGAGDGQGFGIDQLTFSVKPSKGKKTVTATGAIAAGEDLLVGTNVAVTVDVASTFATPGKLDQKVTLGPSGDLTYKGLARVTDVTSGFAGTGGSVTFTADLSPIVADPTGLVINQALIENVNLAEVTGASVALGKKFVTGADLLADSQWTSNVGVYHFRKNVDNTQVKFQVQYKEDYVRCVMVTMTQDGPNVNCTYSALGGGSADVAVGFDFLKGEQGWIEPKPGWKGTYGTSETNWLAIRGITLYRDSRLVRGEELYNPKCIRNVRLEDVIGIGCSQGRGVLEAARTDYPYMCFFNKTDSKITCQLHYWQSPNNTRCVKVTATQDGDDIKLSYASVSGTYGIGTYNFDGSRTETPFSTVGATGNGLGVVGLWLELDPAAATTRRNVMIDAATAETNETYMTDLNVDGDVKLTLKGDGEDFVKILPNAAWVNVTNGADLVINHTNGRNMLGWFLKHNCGFRVAAGSKMILSGLWPIDNFMPIEMNGGELRVGGETPAAGDYNCYLQNLTFRGGLMTGRRPRVGYNTNAKWFVRGSAPSTCETGVALLGETRETAERGPRQFVLAVEDVTQSADVDFTMSGVIANGQNPLGSGIVKQGPGTALLSAANTYDGETRIEGGVLRFGVSGAVLETNVVRMTGGALSLAAGTATTLGKLAFADDAEAAVDFGEGATLVLTDGIDRMNLKRLNLTGAFTDKSVRIVAKVPASALSRVRFGDQRVIQDEDGYLVPGTPGLMLLIK